MCQLNQARLDHMVPLSKASIFSTQKTGYPGTVIPFPPFPLHALRLHIGLQESSESFCIRRVKQIDPFSFSAMSDVLDDQRSFFILPSVLEGNKKLVKRLLLN